MKVYRYRLGEIVQQDEPDFFLTLEDAQKAQDANDDSKATLYEGLAADLRKGIDERKKGPKPPTPDPAPAPSPGIPERRTSPHD